MCDLYNRDYRLLHIKTAMVYWLYPLTIQPIVENAIRHGALTRRDGHGNQFLKSSHNYYLF